MKTTIFAATSAAILLAATTAAFAQQGTTLAGPAQGSKANGESSTMPSAENGALTRGGGMTGRSDSAAPGAPSGTAGTGFGATTTR